MSPWSVVAVPADPASPGALADVLAVRTACTRHTWGTAELADPLEVEVAALRDATYTRREYLAAVEDGRVLGAAFLEFPQRDNTRLAWVNVLVLPDERGRGIGTALWEAAAARVRAAGRTTVQAWTNQAAEPPVGPGTLAPPTGSGLVAADDPDVRFVRAQGFALEQVARRSQLVVPVAGEVLDRFSDESSATAGEDYRLVSWDTVAPDEWLDQYAYVLGRMSTDAPTGGLDQGAEAWDGARVRAQEEELRLGGTRVLVMAAEHVPTHTLAAFTNFWVPPHTPDYVHQGDTLVVPEHRGRRLGMLVKAANLRRLAAELPAVRRVGTWNAEENRWMLAINVALGFRPAGGSGMWQLRLV
jgi:GNAT superfamily N-acetyltransferase